MIGLEFIRKLCDKQIKDVAAEVGVSRQAVSSWEKKERPIPKKHTDTLLEYFNVPDLSFSDLQNDVDTNSEIYLRGLYNRSLIDSESEYDIEKISLGLKVLEQKIESVVRSIPTNNFEYESDLHSAQQQRIDLINHFVDILNSGLFPSKLIDSILKGIECSNDMDINDDTPYLISSVAKIISLYNRHQAEKQQLFESLRSVNNAGELY